MEKRRRDNRARGRIGRAESGDGEDSIKRRKNGMGEGRTGGEGRE